MSLNINGLVSSTRVDEVYDLIADVGAHVVCLQETFLGARHHRPNLLTPMTCTFSVPTPADRTSARASRHKWGVLVALAPSLPVLAQHSPDGLLAGRVAAVETALPSPTGTPRRVAFVSVYAPAEDKHRPPFFSALATFLSAFHSCDLVLAGDWNTDLDSDNTPLMRILAPLNLTDLATLFGPNPLPREEFFTFLDSAGRGLTRIDGVLSTVPSAATGFTTADHEMSTPHRILATRFDLGTWSGGALHALACNAAKSTTTKINIRDKAAVARYKYEIETRLEPILHFASLPLAERAACLDDVTRSFQLAVQEATHVVFTVTHNRTRRGVPPEIREAKIRAKRVSYLIGLVFRLRDAHAMNTPLPPGKMAYAQKVLADPVIPPPSDFSSASVGTWYERAKSTRRHMWEHVAQLQLARKLEREARRKKRPDLQVLSKAWRVRYYGKTGSQLPLVLQRDTHVVTGAHAIKQVMYDHYHRLGQRNQPTWIASPWRQTPSGDAIRRRVARHNYILSQPLYLDEFERAIRRSSSTSRPGPDTVSNNALRILPPRGRDILKAILDTVINTATFPEALNDGIVYSIHKGGSPLEMDNYRGITLLNTLYKLATSIVNERLGRVLRRASATSVCQGGGKPGGQCLHKIAVLSACIADARMSGKHIHVFSGDIRKAFDETEFRGFVDGTLFLGLGPHYLRFEHALHATGKRRVCTAFGLTDPLQLHKGCWQGDGLSPCRFCIFLEPFLRWLEDEHIGYCFSTQEGDIVIPSAGFMDDLHILARTHAEMQRAVTMLGHFLGYYGMRLSPTKCVYVTSAPPDIRQALQVPVADTVFQLPAQGSDFTWRALGFHINLVEDWKLNERRVLLAVQEASEVMRRGYADPHTTSALTTSDVVSRLTYTAQLATFRGTARRTAQRLIVSPIQRNGRLSKQVSAPVLHTMLGTTLVEPLYNAIKVEALLKCLNAPDEHCRIVTTELLRRAQALTPTGITGHKQGSAEYPAYIREGLKALKRSGLQIIDSRPPIHLQSWTVKHATTYLSWNPTRQGLRGVLRRRLQDLSPLFVPVGDVVPIEHLITLRTPAFDIWSHWGLRVLCQGLSLPTDTQNALRSLITTLVSRLSHDRRAPAWVRPEVRASAGLAGVFPPEIWLHSVPAEITATDGSVRDNRAAFAVVTQSQQEWWRLPDETPILQAELLAMLAAVSKRTAASIQTHVDCSAAISLVFSVYHARRTGLYIDPGRIPHAALVYAIVDLIRDSPVFPFVKVAAHTEATDLASTLNRQADHLAKAATWMDRIFYMGHPWQWTQRFTLWADDRALEGPARKAIYTRLATAYCNKVFSTKFPLLAPGTYDPECLHAIRTGEAGAPTQSVVLRIWARTLPVMTRMARMFPVVCEVTHCPACAQPEETIEHLLHLCPAREDQRNDLKEAWFRVLAKYSAQLHIGALYEQYALARSEPDSPYRWARLAGRLHPDLRQQLREAGIPDTVATSLVRQLAKECFIACTVMWQKRCDTLFEAGMTWEQLEAAHIARLEADPYGEALRLEEMAAARALTAEDASQPQTDESPEERLDNALPS